MKLFSGYSYIYFLVLECHHLKTEDIFKVIFYFVHHFPGVRGIWLHVLSSIPLQNAAVIISQVGINIIELMWITISICSHMIIFSQELCMLFIKNYLEEYEMISYFKAPKITGGVPRINTLKIASHLYIILYGNQISTFGYT